METAGNKEFEKDTEKKGLGTPATRATILEKLVSSGYVQRKGKQMIPTEDGVAAIHNIPDYLKSASMTAEWENDLLRMERGEIKPHDFMQGIHLFASGEVENAAYSEAIDTWAHFGEWIQEDIFQRTYQDVITDRRDAVALYQDSKDAPQWVRGMMVPYAAEEKAVEQALQPMPLDAANEYSASVRTGRCTDGRSG